MTADQQHGDSTRLAPVCGYYLSDAQRFCGDMALHALPDQPGYCYCDQHYMALLQGDLTAYVECHATRYCVTCGKHRALTDVAHSELCHMCAIFFHHPVHCYCGMCCARIVAGGGAHVCEGEATR